MATTRRALIFLVFCAALSRLTQAQTTGDRISLYFGDWHTSTPHVIRGSLEERDILTRGDGLNPTRAGSVFRFINSYTYATLAAGASTKPARLDGQQEIYFVASGRGTVTAGGQTADLFRNVAVLMPANLEFTLKSTGDEPLAMYVINEPTPPDFGPTRICLSAMRIQIPISSSNGFGRTLRSLYL
jgi:mannose-6-phosphate isomerase-like protein (cupin superfamily)